MIIGLIGQRFSGVTTAAEVIVEHAKEIGIEMTKVTIEHPEFFKAIFNELRPESHYVIDKLHFSEDLEMLIKAGGRPYKVQSNRDKRKERGFVYNIEVDESMAERDLDLSGHTFHVLGGGICYNTKTMEVFRGTLKEVVRDVFLPGGLKCLK